MGFLNNFLRHHDIDVGKTLGLLTITGGIISFYKMAGQILAGPLLTLDVSAPLGILIGIALWNHRPWARKLAILLGWLAACVFIAIQLSAPLIGNAHLTLNIGSETIPHPSEWMIIVFGVLFAPPLFLFLGALYSETAQEEFRPRPSFFPAHSPHFFRTLLITIFITMVFGGALALNDAHTSYGESGICLNAGSQLTPASDTYYRDATHNLLNQLSSSGFTVETLPWESTGFPAKFPLWENSLFTLLPTGVHYFKRTDKMGRILHLKLDSGPSDANGPTSPEYRISISYSYFIKCWSWENKDFRNDTAIWTTELRQWWLQYRHTHPTSFRDISDRAP